MDNKINIILKLQKVVNSRDRARYQQTKQQKENKKKKKGLEWLPKIER